MKTASQVAQFVSQALLTGSKLWNECRLVVACFAHHFVVKKGCSTIEGKEIGPQRPR